MLYSKKMDENKSTPRQLSTNFRMPKAKERPHKNVDGIVQIIDERLWSFIDERLGIRTLSGFSKVTLRTRREWRSAFKNLEKENIF